MLTIIFRNTFLLFLFIITFNSANSTEVWERTGTFDGEKSGVVLSMGTAKNGNIFACVNTGAPVFRSTNSGGSWQKSSLPSNNYINDFATKDSMMFAASLNGIFRSFNNGLTWKLSNSGLTTTNIKSLTITSNGIIYAGTRGDGVFRSIDNGNTWVSSNTGLSNLKINAIASIDSNNLVVATDGEGLFFSKDGGITWDNGNTEVRLNYVLTLAVSNQGYIYAGTDNYGVFRLKNTENSWENITPQFSGRINTIAITSNNIIYVGTNEIGILYSSDNGITWTIENEGIENSTIAVYCIVVAPNGDVFAGTGGGAVYRRILVNGIENSNDSPKTNFNSIFLINNTIHTSFTLEKKSFVSCTFYSVSGEKIIELINDSFDYGNHKIAHTINSDISYLQGIYYCRFTTPSYNKTQLVYIP